MRIFWSVCTLCFPVAPQGEIDALGLPHRLAVVAQAAAAPAAEELAEVVAVPGEVLAMALGIRQACFKESA